jgi:hypothetical protein
LLFYNNNVIILFDLDNKMTFLDFFLAPLRKFSLYLSNDNKNKKNTQSSSNKRSFKLNDPVFYNDKKSKYNFCIFLIIISILVLFWSDLSFVY